jgi:hypothetical protein
VCESNEQEDPGQVGQILATGGFANVLESDRFKQFPEHIPVAIAVAELSPSKTVTHCNDDHLLQFGI